MGLSPIPFTAIYEYARLFEVEDFEDFHYLMRVMDNTFLKLNKPKKVSDNASTGKKKLSNTG